MLLRHENEDDVPGIGTLANSDDSDYEARMKFQSSMRRPYMLTMLAAVTVTVPATAQEAPEGPLKSRDAKTSEARAPAVDLKIEGVRNGLQIRVLPNEESPAAEGGTATSCEQDCELKLPAGSYTLIASQVERQDVPGADLRAPLRLSMGDTDAARRRLGTTLGVGGIVAAALGSYLAVGALVARDGASGEFPSGLNEFFYLGLAGVGVGAGLVIGGFSLAASNRAPSTAVDRMPPVVQRRGPAEPGLSLSGTF